MNSVERNFVSQLKDNQRIIHKVCRIYTDSATDHEDLFQEICIQLWKAYPGFRGEAKFSTWMYRICLNTAIALFRRTKKSVETTRAEFLDFRVADSEYDDDSHRIGAMYAAIRQLSDIERALIMMYLDDKNYREIGEILGISEGNARVKMSRAKDKLKTLIK